MCSTPRRTTWKSPSRSVTSQYRSHVYLSDVVRLGGRVEAKEIDANENHLVRLTTWAYNQRGQDVMPGTAVIALPYRNAAGNTAGTSKETP